METCRAAYLTAPRSIELVTEAPPRPGPGEALVRLQAVGVCGSDVHWYLDGHIGATKINAPLTLGHEPAGRVVAIGDGVNPVLVGQRVAIEPAIHCGRCRICFEGHTNLCPHVRFLGSPPTQGAFRELLVHPAHLLVPLPDGVSDEVGALLEPLAIAVHAADLLKVRLASNIVILGAGPIGLCALLAARLVAPARVIMIEPLAYRRELALSLGASQAFAPDDADLVAELERATGGYGADYVIEAAGVPKSYELMVEVAQPGAKVAVIGIDPHDRFSFNNSTARRKGLTIYMVRRSRHTLERAIEITLGKWWRPEALITHRLGLSGLATAMEMIAGYKDGVLKAMANPGK